MHSHLEPKLTCKINNVWILWFENSNRYTLVDSENYSILKLFFTAKNKTDFLEALSLHREITISESLALYNDLEVFINDFDAIATDSSADSYEFNDSKSLHTKTYAIYGSVIKINFDSEIVMQLVHPSLAHLEINTESTTQSIFDIYLENENLCLFFNKNFINAFPKKSYHLLQGKFIMTLVCQLYDKREEDWLGLFHASTVSNGKEAIMCIGNSGNGKSTFAASLMANGYALVTDDVSPMLSSNKQIYSYPGAISIKKGAFEALAPLIKNFEDFPSHFINNTKGSVKYLPPNKSDIARNYPCKTVVLINYSPNTNTVLENISIADALQILISDSWISPLKQNAQNFMDWLSDLRFYKLSYSNTNEAIEEFSGLFD